MDLLDIIYFIVFIITFSYACFKLWNATSIRLILPLLCITLLTECVAEYLKVINKNNLFLFHILTPVDYFFYAIIFTLNFQSLIIKRLILFTIPLFFILAFIFYYYLEGNALNNSYAVVLENIILSLWCILYFHELIWERPDTEIRSNPLFWICVGLLFYNTGNLFTIGPFNYFLRQNRELALRVYNLSYIFSFIYFISLILASYNVKKET